MEISISKDKEELGKKAATYAAEIIKKCIDKNGKARIVLSTGASQFETLQELVQKEIDWEKVEMFHLDEYIGIPERHPASFRKYLKERFVDVVGLKKVNFVQGEGEIEKNLLNLTREIRKEPIDLGLIGIGENAHIAFNDPPADFATTEAYIVVNLDEQCRNQQVGEGWFASLEEVPKQAISMTVHQILQCNVIISSVPDKRKAEAVKRTLESEITNTIPATKLKTHDNWSLFLDKDSASLINKLHSSNNVE